MKPDAPAKEQAQWERIPPREHPIVWHRRDGRTSLVIGTTAGAIVGLDAEESAALIDHLNEWATQPQFTLRHRWHQGDLVMFDNTGLLHRALPYGRPRPTDAPHHDRRSGVIRMTDTRAAIVTGAGSGSGAPPRTVSPGTASRLPCSTSTPRPPRPSPERSSKLVIRPLRSAGSTPPIGSRSSPPCSKCGTPSDSRSC